VYNDVHNEIVLLENCVRSLSRTSRFRHTITISTTVVVIVRSMITISTSGISTVNGSGIVLRRGTSAVQSYSNCTGAV
jgi:hypothetical protein